MIRNFFNSAWRNLLKGKLQSVINITGLSIGMAVAMMIGIWIYGELSFNKNFKNYDRIGQVIQNLTINGQADTWWSVPYPLSKEIREHYGSDFKHVVMAVNWGDHLVTYGDKKLKQSGGFFEPGITDMLSLNMIRGKQNIVADPTSVLISAAMAKVYFGKEDPINKMLQIDDMPVVKVIGVYKDFPKNSTFYELQFISTVNFHYNNNSWVKNMDDPWRPNSFTLFVMLHENANFGSASARIKDAKLRKVNEQLAKMNPQLFVMPMSKWHLYSEFKNGVNTGGAIQYVWMFGIIGVFVLILACINFINLSTARSEKRAKEVGIRKTLGSKRVQLVFQFFSESLLTVSFAFIISLVLVQLGLPFFNEVAARELSISWTEPGFWLMCAGFVVFTALVAGLYPAFYLSSFVPVKVLKGTFKVTRFAALPRKALVVLQFTVSVSLIICTYIVYRQIEFAKDRPIGYNRSQLIKIPSTNSVHKHFEVMKQNLAKAGVISSMAESGSPTTGIWNSSSRFTWPGKDSDQAVNFGNVSVSFDYGKTVGWTLIQGRDFSRNFGTDTSALILNEAAVKYIGMKDPVGQTITWKDKPYIVIGVVADMIMESPYDEPRPIVYNLITNGGNIVLLKLSKSVMPAVAVAKVGAEFKKINPGDPFEYSFVDDDYSIKFGEEERISKLSGFFAVLAIAISCLGLLGLTSFVAEQRRKEIGVRKVLGASVLSIWNLLSKEFVVLVIISFVVSIPLSYYFMSGWLENYYYRTSVSWWIFAMAGIIALLIAIFVVSVQVVKAALANPVKSLRTE
jgi:ABC-type antimicrobial peptide transport system permease subunit